MIIPTGSVHCSTCGTSIGAADRCPSCGQPHPALPLGIKLGDRRGRVLLFGTLVVLIAVVALAVLLRR